MSLLEFCDIDGEIGPSEEYLSLFVPPHSSILSFPILRKEFNISLPDLQAHLCCYRRQHISDMMDEFKQVHKINFSCNSLES